MSLPYIFGGYTWSGTAVICQNDTASDRFRTSSGTLHWSRYMSSYWWNFSHWTHGHFFFQFSSTWPYFHFSVWHSLQWRHNEHDSVSNDQRLDRLVRPQSKKTSKLRVTGVCEGNSPVPGEFPAQRVSNAENVSISWRHHVHHNSPSYMPSRICQCCSGTTTLGLYSQSDKTPWSVGRQVSNNKELNVTVCLKFDRPFEGTSGEPPVKQQCNVNV